MKQQRTGTGELRSRVSDSMPLRIGTVSSIRPKVCTHGNDNLFNEPC
jgi:hypothetical protein